ncbi:MAG: hypothetical protein WCR21_11365 [Bacteroidota bacterium]
MKYAFKIVFSFIFCVAVYDCTKQKAFAPNTGNFIVIGDAENMLVKKQDNGIFPSSALSNQLAMDVDDDQVNDFVFAYSGISKTSWSFDQIILTGTSNNCQLFGNYGIDSTFLLETLETGTSLPTSYSGVTNYTIHTLNYTCSRNTAQSKVSSINQHAFRVKALDSLAHLSKSIDFGNDTVLLTSNGRSNFGYQISTTQFLSERSYNRVNCNAFSTNKCYYIGIQIHNKNKDYLGWIKFMYLNNAIKLLETAIQKP